MRLQFLHILGSFKVPIMRIGFVPSPATSSKRNFANVICLIGFYLTITISAHAQTFTTLVNFNFTQWPSGPSRAAGARARWKLLWHN